jgi:hypothetical protein
MDIKLSQEYETGGARGADLRHSALRMRMTLESTVAMTAIEGGPRVMRIAERCFLWFPF